MLKYMHEPWFALLQQACARLNQTRTATALGVSAPQVSQILNGTGKYGSGQAGTENIALKVEHTFGRFPCPHLGEESGRGPAAVVISAEQCRAYAHRKPPTGSPREMKHWQACSACPHKAHTAPPEQRVTQPRKGRVDSTEESL